MSDINSDDLRRMPKSSYLGFSRDLGVLGSVDLMSGVVCADTAHVLLVTFWWCACCMGFVELFWGRLCWHSSRAVGDVLGGPGSCGFGVYLSDHRSFTCLIRIVLKEICGSDASRSLVDCWGLSCWAYWVVEPIELLSTGVITLFSVIALLEILQHSYYLVLLFLLLCWARELLLNDDCRVYCGALVVLVLELVLGLLFGVALFWVDVNIVD